jgi:ABC-type lipoprotein release transport system permease subunit
MGDGMLLMAYPSYTDIVPRVSYLIRTSTDPELVVVATTVGLLGLLLALMRMYGTVSYIVLLRTREIGIRMAIGAQKRDVLALILGEIARPVMAGLLAGVLHAAASRRAMRVDPMEALRYE